MLHAANLLQRLCKRAERKFTFNFPSAANLLQRYYKITSSRNICIYHFYGKYYLHQRRPCTIRAAIRQCCAVANAPIKQKKVVSEFRYNPA